jgi:hypothetical protein
MLAVMGGGGMSTSWTGATCTSLWYVGPLMDKHPSTKGLGASRWARM